MAQLIIRHRHRDHGEPIFLAEAEVSQKRRLLLAAVEYFLHTPLPLHLTDPYEIVRRADHVPNGDAQDDAQEVVLSGDFESAFDALEAQERLDLLMNHFDVDHPEQVPEAVKALLRRESQRSAS